MMRIYFVRHGERDDQSGSLYSRPDIPLTENGKRQAALLAERFASIPIEIIYSSPFLRTRQTTEILNTTMKTEVRYEELLEELEEHDPVVDMFRRANAFVTFLTKQKKQCVLVSAHAGIIKMVVFAMVFGEVHLDRSFKEFNAAFHMDNTGITFCRYDPAAQPYPWHIVTWNDLGHLPPPT